MKNDMELEHFGPGDDRDQDDAIAHEDFENDIGEDIFDIDDYLADGELINELDFDIDSIERARRDYTDDRYYEDEEYSADDDIFLESLEDQDFAAEELAPVGAGVEELPGGVAGPGGTTGGRSKD